MRYLAGGALVAASLAWLPDFGPNGLRWLVLSGIAAGGLFWLAVSVVRSGEIVVTRADMAALAFLIWAGLSLLWSSDPRAGALALQSLGIFVVVFVMAEHMDQRFIPPALALSFAGALVLFSLLPGNTGVFGNENFGVEYMLMAAPFVVVFAVKWPLFGIPLLIAGAVWLTGWGESNARIAIIWACLAGWLFTRRHREAAVLLIIVPLAALTLWPDLVADGLVKSVTDRLELGLNTALLWSEHPIAGQGFGSFDFEYGRVQEAHYWPEIGSVVYASHLYAGAAHNEYLQLLAELGLIGFGIAGAFLWIAFGKVRKRDDRLISAARWSLFITAVCALFSFPLQNPATAVLVAVSLGIVSRGAAVRIPVVSAVSVVAGLALLAGSGFALVGQFHSARVAYFMEEFPLEALSRNLLSLRAWPWDARMRRQAMGSLRAVVTEYPGQVVLEPEAADEIYRISLTAGEHHPGTLLARAEYLLNTGRWQTETQEMETLLSRLTNEQGHKPGVWLVEGAYAAGMKDRERVEAALERSRGVAPAGETEALERIAFYMGIEE